MKTFIGTSGWQYKHWNKRFFPADLPKTEWLPYLSRKFQSVEVNTTFYHMARPTTFLKWKSEVPAGFVFTLKMYRLFTHFRRLNMTPEDREILHAFLENALLLGKKLGAILIQLPPQFQQDLPRLAAFIDILKKEQKILKKRFTFAIEFRHATWFTEDLFRILEKNRIAFVITNSPRWPFAIRKTSNTVYMRFHGRTKLFASNYTKRELQSWAKKLRALEPKTLYAYFNNDANAYAADNALYLQTVFGNATGSSSRRGS